MGSRVVEATQSSNAGMGKNGGYGSDTGAAATAHASKGAGDRRTPAKGRRGPHFTMGDCIRLAWQFFLRDQAALYRGSYVGILWIILPPILAAVGLTLAQRSQIVNMAASGIPFPAHVMLGTVLWQVFNAAVRSPVTTTLKNVPLLAQVAVPSETLFFSEVIRGLLDLVVRLPVVIACFAYFQLPVTPGILGGVGLTVILLMLGLSLGFLLAPVCTLFDDLARSLPFVLNIWMLLTPVFYPPPTGALASLVAQANPVAPLIAGAMEWGTARPLTYSAGLAVVIGVVPALFFLAWFLYKRSLIYLVERR